MRRGNLSLEQQRMVDIWVEHILQHTSAEFVQKNIEATMATMAANPFVNHVPVMTGGVDSDEVRKFYSKYFIPSHPPDTEVVSVARTVGENRIVDELIHKFTHSIEMPWILPGVKPTNKRVEIAVIVIVQFDKDKIVGERIYWDQASVLAQIDLLDSDNLPITGVEASRKVVDPLSESSNTLIRRTI